VGIAAAATDIVRLPSVVFPVLFVLALFVAETRTIDLNGGMSEMSPATEAEKQRARGVTLCPPTGVTNVPPTAPVQPLHRRVAFPP
jgi:hypothetical protein